MAKIGIRDVAERAGVALGTVSRVLNDHPSVTPELRNRVKAVIEELQYHPDPNAQSMRSKTSRLLGIVVPDLTNPYFAELVQSVERSAAARGLSVIVMSSQEDAAAEADRIRALASRKVDGVVLVPTSGFHSVGAPKNLPLVIIDRAIEDRPLVAADHRAGARVAAEYLLSLGHRRIGIAAGPEASAPGRDRLAGFVDAIAAALGSPPSADLVVRGAFDYESGRVAGLALLDRPPAERPTAVFASSDQQAIGCLRAAVDLGIPVPSHLSVVGFDGIFVTNVVTPRLTTVVQPIAEIADAAVAALVDPDRMPRAGEPLLFACRLVERESCAPPSQ